MTEDFSLVAARGHRALLEREHELAALVGLLEDARDGEGRVMLIEGPAGIGKTRLLDRARESAGGLGLSVLIARGGELERDFGFGVVRHLLEPALARAARAQREELLAGAAALAAPVFGEASAEVRPGSDLAAAVTHGLYWLVANLAERSPLLVAIDDVHWVDRPSLRFLAYLCRRLEGLPVAVVLATRTGETPTDPELVRALALVARPPILRPAPLTECAAASLVRARLGDEATAEVCSACHEATKGNPFLLEELVEDLRGRPGGAGELRPAAIGRLASERVATAVLMRVGRLGAGASALARAVAVLGERAGAAESAALAGLEPASARSVAWRLAQAAVLEPDEPFRFVHPIVRTAIYADFAEPERAAMHARAASLLFEQGAGPESVAVHLLATQPGGDDRVVSALREAGRAAISRGAPETAVRYLRRALAEPPVETARAEVMLDLGSAATRVGEPDGLDLMREAFALAAGQPMRATAGLALGGMLLWQAREVDECVEVLERSLDGLDDPGLATPIEAQLLLAGITTASARRRVAGRLRDARSRVGRLSPDRARLLLAPLAGDVASSDGTAAEAAQLAERALADGTLVREQIETDLPLAMPPVVALVYADRLGTAERTMNQLSVGLRGRGSPVGLVIYSAYSAFVRHRAGELGRAEADARTSIELAPAPGWGIPTQRAASTLVAVLVERGDLEGAHTILEGVEASVYDPEVMPIQALRESRAKLRLAEGEPAAALDELLAVARWERDWSPSTGVMPVAWRSAAARIHAALGDRDTARAMAGEEVELARRFGAPRAIGVALAALGIAEGGERGIELLADAVSMLARSGDRLEHARSAFDLGSALRRAGRRADAKQRLAEGMDLAHRCAAACLVEAAREELRLAGARPRRAAISGPDALTAGERRVAELASEGMTNKAIAQALFVTRRTVEMHLSNAYSKLNIRSRQELLRSLKTGERS